MAMATWSTSNKNVNKNDMLHYVRLVHDILFSEMTKCLLAIISNMIKQHVLPKHGESATKQNGSTS